MKSFVIGLALLVASASVLADTRPSKQLVEQYIKQAQAEQEIAAQVVRICSTAKRQCRSRGEGTDS